MGTLNVDRWSLAFEDRMLTHLQVVIINRFRRGDSVLMSWIDSVAVGSGRSSIWLTPAVPVLFTFAGSRIPTVNREWVKRLDASASASTGLIVTEEDGTPARVGEVSPLTRHVSNHGPQYAGGVVRSPSAG